MAFSGLELVMAVRVELLEAVEPVQVVAAVDSLHLTWLPTQPCGTIQVSEVAPPMEAVPLYHCQVLAPVFSESPSGSDQEPALQVRVLPELGVPVMVGVLMEGMWSG